MEMEQSPIAVKVGGSLLKQAGGAPLRGIAKALRDAGAKRPVYLVAGGGPFADLVREQHHRWALDEETSHFMAAAAMDQFAWLLHGLIPGSGIADLAPEKPRPGVHILLFSHYLRALPAAALPRDWRVTSDTLAAHAAALLGCRALLLLKSADFSAANAGEALDDYFPQMLPLPFPVWLLNGRTPGPLKAWLQGGAAPGPALEQGTASLILPAAP